MCDVCGGTGMKKEWVRYGVSNGTGPKGVLWANHFVLEPCQCQILVWTNPKQPIFKKAAMEG